jgi:hypothetical protein
MAINQGGAAFPRAGFLTENGDGNFDNEPQEGMTFREYAAVHLLAALLTEPAVDATYDLLVTQAVDVADSLIAELEE